MTDTTPRLGRRQFLAGGAAAGAFSLAGCVTGPPLATGRTVGPPRELVGVDGRERHLVFGDGDDHEVVFTLRQEAPLPAVPGPHPEWIPFHAVVHHREGLRTDRLTLRLHAPPRDGSPFDADVYLGPPSTGTGAFGLDRTPDGWTVLDAGGLGTPPPGGSGAPGDANVHLYFVVSPLSGHPVGELHAEFEAELSERRAAGRRSRRATGRMTFPFVRG